MIKSKMWLAFAAVLVAASLADEAAAHKPDFGDAEYGGPESAYAIEDPAVSIVVYREVTCDRPQLWMRLDGEAGFPLYMQLLVPTIERLDDYRPSLALVGPGLPQAPSELDVPAGYGARVFHTGAVTPIVFDERFTGTSDWILVEETVTLPRDGTYYVVAWDPRHQTGKLAVAVGTVEDFGPIDLIQFPGWRLEARRFHELGRFAPDEPVVETRCR